MKIKTILAIIVLTACSHAQTVLQNVISLDNSGTFGAPFGEYTLTVYQDFAQTNYTSIWFDKSGDTLIFRNSKIDEGSDWYFVTGGDVFSDQTFATPFNGVDNSFLITSSDFYLGVATGIGFTGGLPNRTVLGWVQLNNSVSGIQLLSSAVAYNSVSIQVGTTNAVAIPEPASYAALISIGCAAFAFFRRKRNSA